MIVNHNNLILIITIIIKSGDDYTWLAIRCWVKCNSDGTPVEPFDCVGPCSSIAKPTSGKAKPTLDHFIKPGLHPEIAVGSGSSQPMVVPHDLCLADHHDADEPGNDQLMQTSGNFGTQPSASSDLVPAAVDMVTEMWKHQKLQQAKDEKDKTWHHDLPKVVVKPSHLNHAAVPGFRI